MILDGTRILPLVCLDPPSRLPCKFAPLISNTVRRHPHAVAAKLTELYQRFHDKIELAVIFRNGFQPGGRDSCRTEIQRARSPRSANWNRGW